MTGGAVTTQRTGCCYLFGVILLALAGGASAAPTEHAISVDTPAGVVPGTLYVPDPARPAPGILVLHTAGGLLPADRLFAARLAAEGFVTLIVPYTAGWDDATNAPLANVVDWLAQRAEVGGLPVGVVGFSLGASKALLLAARRPAIQAVVAYYATYDVKKSKFARVLRPGVASPSPVETAGQIRGAVLLLNAEQDDETPPDQTEQMIAALSGKTFELVRYPKGRHLFEREPQYHPPGGKTKFGTLTEYDADAARDSWERTLAWFRKYLGQPRSP